MQNKLILFYLQERETGAVEDLGFIYLPSQRYLPQLPYYVDTKTDEVYLYC